MPVIEVVAVIILTTSIAHPGLTFFEVWSAIVGIAIGIAAVLTAIAGIFKGVGRAWKWLKRFIKTVDTIAVLPESLACIDKRMADHIEVADRKAALLDSLDERVTELMAVAKDVHYELKHNGGGSTKDAVGRIETGISGLSDQITAQSATAKNPAGEATNG